MSSEQNVDLVMELKKANELADTMISGVSAFLNEVGAPSLTEARDRFLRFASATVESAGAIRSRDEEIHNLRVVHETMQRALDKYASAITEMRREVALLRTSYSNATENYNAAIAALQETRALLLEPMFSEHKKEIRHTQRAIDAVLRKVNPKIEVESPDAETIS